jgi:ATP-dependent Lon protease
VRSGASHRTLLRGEAFTLAVEPFMPNVRTLPVLPLRDIVVFPHMAAPLFVGREKSVRALEEVRKANIPILLAAQMEASEDDPSTDRIYRIGTIANVVQLLKLPDGTVRVLVEGTTRATILNFVENESYFEAEVEDLPEGNAEAPEAQAAMHAVALQFAEFAKLSRKTPPEVQQAISQITDPAKLADTIAAHLTAKVSDKQALLEIPDVPERLERVLAMIEGEIGVMNVEKRIRSRVKRQMEKTQREYYLNEQMKAIQRELGEGDDGREDIAEFERRIKRTKLSKEARTKADAELKKLKQMSPISAESTVVRNYLETLLSLPWGIKKKVKRDITEAQAVLEDDHYGLDKVKERILEYLSVQARTNKLRGPILCLVGPPGVGKTSLGKSIAKATGRDFVRVSLGGVRDEAEIRGHRRTYIGSMPGRIVQSLRKAKSTNPLFLLDEIDKLGADYRGDPSAALLEVLDPEQNATFNDHYLEVDYDLSDIMFITTANSLNMPQPLLDRMEIIRIPGYTEEEKLEISRKHLLPKQQEAHGLKEKEFEITDGAILDLVRRYTREAGVRNLERELANVCRKAVREIEQKKVKHVAITEANLADYAGVWRYRYGETEEEDRVGMVTGLAWTETGGDLLTIEAVQMPGKGAMIVTGNLREVMKESISAANSYVRSRAVHFGVRPQVFRTRDIHVHVPEGATPKDGPSAGVAMVTAIVSVLTGVPVRKDVAMTGEVTLRGRILPIGGLKEKLLAALRGGVRTVLIPKENEKDLAEVPDSVKTGLTIIPVGTVDEALSQALAGPLTPLPWTEEDEAALNATLSGEDGGAEKRPH